MKLSTVNNVFHTIVHLQFAAEHNMFLLLCWIRLTDWNPLKIKTGFGGLISWNLWEMSKQTTERFQAHLVLNVEQLAGFHSSKPVCPFSSNMSWNSSYLGSWQPEFPAHIRSECSILIIHAHQVIFVLSVLTTKNKQFLSPGNLALCAS